MNPHDTLTAMQRTILRTANAARRMSNSATIHPHETHNVGDYEALQAEELIEGSADKGFKITQKGRDKLVLLGG
jgi:hypothetical protein